jgi:hypothetical protein
MVTTQRISSNRWKYSRGFVFDGNFSAEQLKMKRPEDDVHLTDGSGFFTAEGQYQKHLKVAIEIKEVSCCNLDAPSMGP